MTQPVFAQMSYVTKSTSADSKNQMHIWLLETQLLFCKKCRLRTLNAARQLLAEAAQELLEKN